MEPASPAHPPEAYFHTEIVILLCKWSSGGLDELAELGRLAGWAGWACWASWAGCCAWADWLAGLTGLSGLDASLAFWLTA